MMTSSEKLDFLMKLTDTRNNVLGKQLSFDPSYISRIRSGKRAFPGDDAFAAAAGAFFAEHLTGEVQRKIFCDLMGEGAAWPDSPEDAKAMLTAWLKKADSSDRSVEKMLSGISAVQMTGLPALDIPANRQEEQPLVKCFYGNAGKRAAVTEFLTELCAMDHPPRLLLYSNEPFSWMYEDQEFAKKWALLLFTYIQKGGKIRITHTISRASGEMLMALQKWIPVYMTGAIEPYYYPKILDRVFRKTLFIAEGHSAITAGSVGEHTENALNLLIRDKEACAALEQEYHQFFAFCKPLMQIFGRSRREPFLALLQQFHEAKENMITVRTTPSFFTMPGKVAEQMDRRLGSDWVQKRQQAGNAAFASMMESGCSLTEILNLPDPKAFPAAGVPFPLCDLFDNPGLFYERAEWIAHLKETVARLEAFDRYQVVLSSAIPANELVYVKEDSGLILLKADQPSIAFAIDEQRMVSAFWDYLSEITENGTHKSRTIAVLNRQIALLEKS